MKTLIISNDSKINLSNNNIVITNSKGSFNESLDCISLIIIYSDSSITTNLINEVISKNIPIIICNNKKLPHAYITPYYGTINRFENISKQIKWNKSKKKEITLSIIKNKIENQEKVIKELLGEKDAYKDYLDSLDIYNMDKCEAFVARKYFYSLFGTSFNRRDLNNEINHKLNYGYAIIASIITIEIVSHGYLTEFGINHHSKTNNLNFTYDIIEPFRQVIDRYVYKTKDKEFNLEYKNNLVLLLYSNIKYNGKDYSVINAIKEYVLSIIKSLNGKSSIGYIDLN